MKRSTAAVMLRLIYTCGLRPGEGLRLKTKNVNIDTGEILVTETKLKKERIIVMHDDMKHLMRRYTMKVVLSGRDNTFFFPNQNGQSYMTTWLDNIVKICFERSHSDIDRMIFGTGSLLLHSADGLMKAEISTICFHTCGYIWDIKPLLRRRTTFTFFRRIS